MPVKPVPDGYHTVTPVLVVEGAAGLIEFMQKVFDGKERMRMPMPDGRIGHAEIEIGDSVVMTADAQPQYPAASGLLHLFVEDCDTYYKRALEAGATSEMELADQFYGDRTGVVRDPWGNRWSISTHIEDVSEDEMMKRMQAMFSGAGQRSQG
jgi:PhnB protein